MCDFALQLRVSFPNLSISAYEELDGRLGAQFQRGYMERNWYPLRVRDEVESYMRSIYPFNTDEWLDLFVLECKLAYDAGARERYQKDSSWTLFTGH
jgi:hypothetical protein